MICVKNISDQLSKGIMAQQVLLANSEGLIGKDLGQAYSAVKAGRDVSAGMTVRWDTLSSHISFNQCADRFKKKEDIGALTKSILKHKIQTLTGKSVKVA